MRLLTETRRIAPGQTFTLAIEFTVPRGWHTYWENPGDSGMAPSFSWRSSPGIQPLGVRFPVPARMEDHGIVTLGYEGTVHLLADFQAGVALTGRTARVDLDALWMVCKDVCAPIESAGSAVLDVEPAGSLPAAGADSAFAAWRRRLPGPTDGWPVSVERTGGALRLRIEPTAEAASALSAATAGPWVLPRRRGALSLGGAPAWTRAENVWTAELTEGPSVYSEGERFEAVLAVDGPDGPGGWTVEAVVAAPP
jgi:DsbC/DsbD-like thiol-disulfide interchange protein